MGELINKIKRAGKKIGKNKTALAYIMIITVLFMWGIAPTLQKSLNDRYSAGLRNVVTMGISAIALFLICLKKIKKINASYFKVAVPTGVFMSIASLIQKIGLLYTTPAKYAFLENLSCVVVPLILFIVIKKKPSLLTIISCILCLVGSFILGGNFGQAGGFSLGIGEILCALAGVFYGVNIAFTGIKIKKFDTSLYLFIQLTTATIVGFLCTLFLAYVPINGTVIEPIKFSWDIDGLLLLLFFALVCTVLCWLLRTKAMKYVNPTAVSVIMPFSSVIASVFSIVVGMDVISYELAIGGLIVLVAAILSSVADVKYEQKNS